MTSYISELCADGLAIMMRHIALTEETNNKTPSGLDLGSTAQEVGLCHQCLRKSGV